MPAKVEHHHPSDAGLVTFHDVLSDEEIIAVQRMADRGVRINGHRMRNGKIGVRYGGQNCEVWRVEVEVVSGKWGRGDSRKVWLEWQNLELEGGRRRWLLQCCNRSAAGPNYIMIITKVYMRFIFLWKWMLWSRYDHSRTVNWQSGLWQCNMLNVTDDACDNVYCLNLTLGLLIEIQVIKFIDFVQLSRAMVQGVQGKGNTISSTRTSKVNPAGLAGLQRLPMQDMQDFQGDPCRTCKTSKETLQDL